MPGVPFSFKYAPTPKTADWEIMRYFNIGPAEYDYWHGWFQSSGHDLDLSGFYDELSHLAICDCWLKGDEKFKMLTSRWRLMIFMILQPACSCYFNNRIK